LALAGWREKNQLTHSPDVHIIHRQVTHENEPMITNAKIFRGAFVRGMAQAFDLTGAIASRRLSRFRNHPGAVRNALGADWRAVTRDFTIVERWRANGIRRPEASS
jgi:hypothetical protein